MHRRAAGGLMSVRNANLWGDVVDGIVERVDCEVFMACNFVELCVKERRVSRTSVPESERDGPRDGTRARARCGGI